MLIAHTSYGLANRLRFATSAMILAERLNRECRIIWPCNPDLNCGFNDLFQRSQANLLELPPELGAIDPLGREAPKRLPESVTSWQDSDPVFRAGELDDSMHPALTLHEADLRGLGEILYIRGCHEFRPAELAIEDYLIAYARILNEVFQPNEDILSDVISLPPGTIGVHVRRGDKYSWISRRLQKRCSYLQNYLPRLSELLDSAPSRKIFVASDDNKMKDSLRAIWKERVVTYPDVVQSRDSVGGVKHALRDLYTLSRCSVVLTDGDSTFGPLAARYQNRPVENMRRSLAPPSRLRMICVRASEALFDRPSRRLLGHVHTFASRRK